MCMYVCFVALVSCIIVVAFVTKVIHVYTVAVFIVVLQLPLLLTLPMIFWLWLHRLVSYCHSIYAQVIQVELCLSSIVTKPSCSFLLFAVYAICPAIILSFIILILSVEQYKWKSSSLSSFLIRPPSQFQIFSSALYFQTSSADILHLMCETEFDTCVKQP